MELFEAYIWKYTILLIIEGSLSFLMLETAGKLLHVDDKIRLFTGVLMLASLCDITWEYYEIQLRGLTWFCSIVCYCANPATITLLDQIIYPEEKRTIRDYIPLILIEVFLITTPLHHQAFYFGDEVINGRTFVYGKLYSVYIILMIANCLPLIIHAFEPENCILKTRKYLTLFLLFMCNFSAELARHGIGQNQIFNIAAAIIPINYLYLYYQKTNERLETQERQIRQKRQELTLSQIKPHFLYNTLATIRFMIRTDPDLAVDTLEHFSSFLRNNLDAADLDYPIPVNEELKHAENFAEIEMIRFCNIDIQFIVEDSDYLIPALTVQTLLENAIHHGVSSSENGLVIVKAWREKGHHLITITDNGKGFDPDNAEYHTGIRMVKERLQEMVGGELTIESAVGIGTLCTIRIAV